MEGNFFFKDLTNHFNNNLPFVAYRKPNHSSVKALLQKDTELHIATDFKESGFVFAPFNSEEQTIIIPVSDSETLEFVIPAKAGIHNDNSKINKIPVDLGMTAKAYHINLVARAIDVIKKDNLKKVVLSRCENLAVKVNPIDIFKKLLQNYTTAFVYCWYHPKVGLWLGATPETLLKVEGNHFETMSLAGTQAYNGTLDVKWNTKEVEEQQIVTDSIVSKLNTRVTNLKVSETQTIKAGNLLHLQTKVSGIINSEASNVSDVINQLHPTPAVCGFPKAEAKAFILKNENYNREFYTGFLGELNVRQTRSRNTNRRNVENNAYTSVKTVSNLYVNLRCLQLKDDEALIYVGGGITKDSIAENEWEETQKKTQTMKSVL